MIEGSCFKKTIILQYTSIQKSTSFDTIVIKSSSLIHSIQIKPCHSDVPIPIAQLTMADATHSISVIPVKSTSILSVEKNIMMMQAM